MCKTVRLADFCGICKFPVSFCWFWHPFVLHFIPTAFYRTEITLPQIMYLRPLSPRPINIGFEKVDICDAIGCIERSTTIEVCKWIRISPKNINYKSTDEEVNVTRMDYNRFHRLPTTGYFGILLLWCIFFHFFSQRKRLVCTETWSSRT